MIRKKINNINPYQGEKCHYKCVRSLTKKIIARYRFQLTFLCVVLTGTALESNAQLSRKSQEVWPSIDAYYKLNQRFRFYGTVAGTKLDESSYSDGALGIFVDYFSFRLIKNMQRKHADSLPGKYLWLRGGYQYSATPPSAEDPFKESMIVTEANARIYLPFDVLLSWKNRFDWRSKNGDFNGRYRPRLMLEKDLHTQYLFFTAYGYAEYFLNFGNSAVNRFRTQIGVEIRVTKQINYEAFWNHQFSNAPEVQEIDAFGMTLKLYLARKQKTKK